MNEFASKRGLANVSTRTCNNNFSDDGKSNTRFLFSKSIISSLVACLKKNQIKRILLDDNPAIIYMFKVNNSNTKC